MPEHVKPGLEIPAHKNCFVCGTPGDGRIDVCYFWHEETREVTARVVFGPLAQGPPLHTHGGAIFAVLDETMGTCAWLCGHICVAANIDIDFRQMIPLNQQLQIKCGIDRLEGRKIFLHGKVTNEGGDILAESEGIFVTVPADKMSNLLPGLLGDMSALERWQHMRAGGHKTGDTGQQSGVSGQE